jgi:hypothetical protein
MVTISKIIEKFYIMLQMRQRQENTTLFLWPILPAVMQQSL